MMKFIIFGSVVVLGGVLLAVHVLRRNRKEQTADVRQEGLDCGDQADREIIEALPCEMREAILRADGKFPERITSEWINRIVVERISCGNFDVLDSYFAALISVGAGVFGAAAKTGEPIDVERMRPYSPGKFSRVSKLYHRGLIRSATGEVLLKAVVA